MTRATTAMATRAMGEWDSSYQLMNKYASSSHPFSLLFPTDNSLPHSSWLSASAYSYLSLLRFLTVCFSTCSCFFFSWFYFKLFFVIIGIPLFPFSAPFPLQFTDHRVFIFILFYFIALYILFYPFVCHVAYLYILFYPSVLILHYIFAFIHFSLFLLYTSSFIHFFFIYPLLSISVVSS